MSQQIEASDFQNQLKEKKTGDKPEEQATTKTGFRGIFGYFRQSNNKIAEAEPNMYDELNKFDTGPN